MFSWCVALYTNGQVDNCDRKTVASLMIFPNPDSSLNEEAGKQQQDDFEGYCKVGTLA